ncbi:MAG: lipopolysaccharide biosynthesis protein [Bacteroidaceae bacterium]|nr:lipopolysaccharide biosynthesis protein [Bacteroidaceae bacterium]
MSVSKQIASNALWKYLEQFSVMGIQFLGTFIMARVLSPSDYGVIGIMSVFTILSNTIINSGFGQAIIREKEVSRLDYSTILYFNVFVSVLLYIILYFSSGVIADFYNQPIIADVSKITFLVLPLNALSIVQNTKLQKEVRFKKLCFISLISSLLSCIIAVCLAYTYRNVWALVFQNVLTYFFRVVLLWGTSNFIPTFRFSLSSFKYYFKFSKNLLFSGLIGVIFNNIYTLIIGKVYTTAELGFYTQAERFKNLGAHTTTEVVQAITYPILARLNNENGDIKEGYRKIINITVMIVGFVMALLMGCGEDLFEFLMGNEIWRMSGIYLFLMGINGILYPLHCINQNVLMVKGDSRTILLLEIVRRIIMIVILVTTMRHGIMFFVFGLSIYSIILLFVNLYYCGRPISYTLCEQLKDVCPILLRLLIIICVTLSFSTFIPIQTLSFRLFLSVFFGISIGLLCFWRYYYFQLLLKLVKSLIKKK